MMGVPRINAPRRTALLEATVDLLAQRGGRGLTFRAVDEQAGVPTGTTSNYFDSRDDLLRQACGHLLARLEPDPAEVAERMAARHDRDLEVQLMRDIVRRATEDRSAYLAMFELRMEATRSPAVADTLTEHFRANLDRIVTDHVGGGFPGDRRTAVVLYLAMMGLLLEFLTLPGVLGSDGADVGAFVEDLVTSIVPQR